MVSYILKVLRRLLNLVVVLIISLGVLLLCFHESRSFYRLSDDEYVTVWKHLYGKCYIISGKYYGLWKPSENFVKTTNTNTVTAYWTTEMPNAFILRSDDNIESASDIKNEVFLSYGRNVEKFRKLLYKPNATKRNDIKDNVNMAIIRIKEGYATDKNGDSLQD